MTVQIEDITPSTVDVTDQVLVRRSLGPLDYTIQLVPWPTGGGATNLAYDAATRVVSSDTGTDATLTVADGTNAGLMTSANFTKLAGWQQGQPLIAPMLHCLRGQITRARRRPQPSPGLPQSPHQAVHPISARAPYLQRGLTIRRTARGLAARYTPTRLLLALRDL